FRPASSGLAAALNHSSALAWATSAGIASRTPKEAASLEGFLSPSGLGASASSPPPHRTTTPRASAQERPFSKFIGLLPPESGDRLSVSLELCRTAGIKTPARTYFFS